MLHQNTSACVFIARNSCDKRNTHWASTFSLLSSKIVDDPLATVEAHASVVESFAGA